MSDILSHPRDVAELAAEDKGHNDDSSERFDKLQGDFQSRLLAANLRTEAVRAGMVDLDGLKLVDLSKVQLGSDDRVIGGRQLMDELRRNKPWLFMASSSSSTASAPASQQVRQKSALDMTDEEYAAARKIVTKYQF
jgi:hypothetical protein